MAMLVARSTIAALATRALARAPAGLGRWSRALATGATPPPPAGVVGAPAGGGGAAAGTAAIVEVDAASFEALVVRASLAEPPVGGAVLVDAYADWCAPCKALTPKLERLVLAAKGAVRLAKLNVDANPELAQSLQIKSLPTVLLVHKGKLVDSFTGVLPDEQVAAFVKRAADLGGGAASAERALADAAAALEAGQVEGARALYTALGQLPEHAADAAAGLTLCAVAEGDGSQARSLAATLAEHFKAELGRPLLRQALAQVGAPPRRSAYARAGRPLRSSRASAHRARPHPAARALLPPNPTPQVELLVEGQGEAGAGAEGGEPDGGVEGLRARLASEPSDLAAKHALAARLVAAGQHGEAIELCLQIIKQVRPACKSEWARRLQAVEPALRRRALRSRPPPARPARARARRTGRGARRRARACS